MSKRTLGLRTVLPTTVYWHRGRLATSSGLSVIEEALREIRRPDKQPRFLQSANVQRRGPG